MKKQKVFGVGFSKTGTTTLERAFKLLGYKAWHGHWQNPNQFYSAALYIHKDYDELFKIVEYYDAFSDGPWGGSDMYLEMYRRMPESKFILTIRDAESWYVSFEKLITMFDLNLETALDSYHINGMCGSAYFFSHVFNIKTLAGNRQRIIDHYNTYNQNVIDFFSKNRADFMVFDIPGGDGWKKLCNFLDKPIPNVPFPHENKAIDNPYLSNILERANPVKKVEDVPGMPDVSLPMDSLKETQEQRPVNDLSLLKRVKQYLKLPHDLYLLHASGLFDKKWYLLHNPDVAQAKVNPAIHYLRSGGGEGRDPGPNFSSKWYLDSYEDVKNAGINPLIHYAKYGWREGRFARSQQVIVSPGSFFLDYLKVIDASIHNWHKDNYDFLRFGPAMLIETPPIDDISQVRINAIELVRPHLPRVEWLYNQLSDDLSREILVKLFAFRALGYRRVKLPLSTPAYWDGIKKMDQLTNPGDSISTDFLGMHLQLSLISLHEIGFPLRFYGSSLGAYQGFVLEQYRCKDVEVGPGDIVVDAGACWGETTLYFAHRTGESGRVFSYEFVPENLDILHRNLALNPEISKNIQIIDKAVWHESDVVLSFEANGPATRVGNEKISGSSVSVPTLSIDDLVARNDLHKLDFIKMDIEGAELPALRGAVHTLLRFKPKLAIAVYHNLTDFFDIPEFLNLLGLGYRFSLRHFSIHAEETVLYAAAD